MRNALTTLLICISFLSWGQSRLFVLEAEKQIQKKDSYSEIESVLPSSDVYDFVSEGNLRLNGLFLSSIKGFSKNHPDELTKSNTLTKLAEIATSSWKGSQYSDKKKWKGIAKHFRRAFEKSSSKFNHTEQISFRVPLVDKGKNGFYFDRKGSEGGLNLYKGKRPKSRVDEDGDDIEQIPLELMTEQDLIEKFEREIKRSGWFTNLKRGRYSYVGLSVEIDEKTLYKNRIPTARIVVVLGARRLRDVRVKAVTKVGNGSLAGK